jgi:pre-rRNA-processing protein TSR4
MTLLLQLNGDLPEKFPGHERWLYIFGCRRKTCRRKEGSIKSLRGNRISKSPKTEPKSASALESKAPAPRTDLGTALFGGPTPTPAQSNPFSSGNASISANPFSSGLSSANPFGGMSALAAKPAQEPVTSSFTASFASKAKIADSETVVLNAPPRPHEPWPSTSDLPPAYPIYYFDVEYETLDKPSNQQVDVDAHMTSIDTGEGSSGGAEDKVLFESTMDKAFQKFADRLGQNPEQALRYEFRGTPLLYSTADAIGKRLAPEHTGRVAVANADGSRIPRCQNCGSGRVFEAQLTPHAITVLEEDEMTLEGMEWGTILLAVCSKDCSPQGTSVGEVGYTEEWAGVQWEEVTGSKR